MLQRPRVRAPQQPVLVLVRVGRTLQMLLMLAQGAQDWGEHDGQRQGLRRPPQERKRAAMRGAGQGEPRARREPASGPGRRLEESKQKEAPRTSPERRNRRAKQRRWRGRRQAERQ